MLCSRQWKNWVVTKLGTRQKFYIQNKIRGSSYLIEIKEEKWSGRMDLNHRPPGPEPGALARLRYAPTDKLRRIFPAQAGLPD
jgi:hypothetical protein